MLWFESAPLLPPLCRCDQNRTAFTGLSYLDRPECVKVNPVGQCVFFETKPPAPAKTSLWKRLRNRLQRPGSPIELALAILTMAAIYFGSLSRC